MPSPPLALTLRSLLAVCLLTLSTASLSAATLTVDGDATDWGFTVADNNGSTFVPDGSLNLVGLFVEDSDDLAGDYEPVGPSLGGQNYDCEVLAAAVQGSDLHLIVVSGQRPDNGLTRYAPGDLRITTSAGVFGVEMGGGPGGGPGTMQVGGETGSTYTLDNDGYSVSHADAAPAQTVGSVWANPNWIFDLVPPTGETQLDISGGGTYVGDATFRFTRDMVTTQHSIIELSIPLSFFGGAMINGIAYYPACGNDELVLDTQFVPEPSTFGLAALAAVALMPWWRRRRGR